MGSIELTGCLPGTMESIQLDKYGQNATIHAQAEDDGANGFDKQPEYGRNYDPSDDKRGTHSYGMQRWRAIADVSAWLRQTCIGLEGSRS